MESPNCLSENAHIKSTLNIKEDWPKIVLSLLSLRISICARVNWYSLNKVEPCSEIRKSLIGKWNSNCFYNAYINIKRRKRVSWIVPKWMI